MEENMDYRAYRYGDRLSPGAELKIEHSIYCDEVDISSLIAQGEASLETMRQDSLESENKAYDRVVDAAIQWEKQAVVTQTVNRALEYLHTPEITHSNNQWQKETGYRDGEEISNRVYKMSCSVWEDTKYDRDTKQHIPVAWYVTWDVYVHTPKQGFGTRIAGQLRKRYTDKDAAMKYLDGRKKAFSHLFTEVSPPIPKEYAHHFTLYGALLPGYTVEGQEIQKNEHTAAEVTETMAGGVSASREDKPSVLEKLSEAKEQKKAVPAAAKKKPEIEI